MAQLIENEKFTVTFDEEKKKKTLDMIKNGQTNVQSVQINNNYLQRNMIQLEASPSV